VNQLLDRTARIVGEVLSVVATLIRLHRTVGGRVLNLVKTARAGHATETQARFTSGSRLNVQFFTNGGLTPAFRESGLFKHPLSSRPRAPSATLARFARSDSAL